MEVPPIFSTEILEDWTSDMDRLRGAKGLEGRANALHRVCGSKPAIFHEFLKVLSPCWLVRVLRPIVTQQNDQISSSNSGPSSRPHGLFHWGRHAVANGHERSCQSQQCCHCLLTQRLARREDCALAAHHPLRGRYRNWAAG
jgi:hypothetical protein